MDTDDPQVLTQCPTAQTKTQSYLLYKWTNIKEAQTRTYTSYLQPLYDVPVVPWCGHHRVSAGSIANRKSPAHGCLLDNVVGFHKQVVHLVVQVHRDGYCSAFGCKVHTKVKEEKSALENLKTQLLNLLWEESSSYQHLRALWYSSQLIPSGLGSASYSGRPWILPATAAQRLAAWSEGKTRKCKIKGSRVLYLSSWKLDLHTATYSTTCVCDTGESTWSENNMLTQLWCVTFPGAQI